MEKDVRFLPVYRHIRGGYLSDWLGWCADILVMFVLCQVLIGISLYILRGC